MRSTVTHCVACNLYWSGQLVRLALNVLMQNCNDFMEATHLQLSTDRGRRCVEQYGGNYAETSTNLVLRIIFVLRRCNVTAASSTLHLTVLAVSGGNLPYKNPGFFVLQKFPLLHFEASRHASFTHSCKINTPI